MLESISSIRVVFTEELTRQLRSKGWWISAAFIPALLIIILVMTPVVKNMLQDDGSNSVGYVDLSGTFADTEFPNFSQYDTRASGLEAVLSDDIKDLFVVQADFIESGQVEWLTQKAGVFSGVGNRREFSNFIIVALVEGNVEQHLIERVKDGADYVRIRVSKDGFLTKGNDELNQYGVPFVLSLLLMMAVFGSSFKLLQSVAEEKENKMIDVLLTSLTPFSLITGKILAFGTGSLVQMVISLVAIVVIGPAIILQIAPNIVNESATTGGLSIAPLSLIYLCLFFFAGYFLFAVVLAGIGAITPSMKEAGPIGSIIVLPIGIPLYLATVILSAPEGKLASVLSLIPFTAPTATMQRIGATGISNAEILLSLGITLVTAIVLLFIVARVFRAGLLLYGKSMSPRAIWVAIK